MLRYRLASAIIMIPLIIGSVILGGLAFFAVITVALLIADYEFFQMAARAGYRPNVLFGLVLCEAFLLDAFLGGTGTLAILAVALVVSLTAAVLWPREGWITGWSLTLAGALYIGVLGSYALFMRRLPDGAIWTALALLATWATDTAAFVTGTRFGRHGFFKNISPKKTWEGAVGGWTASTLAMMGLGWIAGLPLIHGFLLGLGIGIAGSLGDLAESVVKRQLGAKDSGAIVPGHGGLLDRIDSLLFAAVFAYYYLVWIVRL